MGSVLTPTVRLFYLVVRARFLHLEVIHNVPILPLLKLSRMQDRPLLFMGVVGLLAVWSLGALFPSA